jgi:hypothetical protein
MLESRELTELYMINMKLLVTVSMFEYGVQRAKLRTGCNFKYAGCLCSAVSKLRGLNSYLAPWK